MRSRVLLVVAAVSFSITDLSAQRVILPPQSGRAPRPAEKPPQAPGIPNAQNYSRYRMSRFSGEQYMTVTHLSTEGYARDGFPTTFLLMGDGTRFAFRATPSLSASADLTTAVYGGPFAMGTFDLGLRVTPWASLRFKPFVDARTSWAFTQGARQGSYLLLPGVALAGIAREDYATSYGRGRVFGLGVETSIRPRFIVATQLASTHHAMRARELNTFRQWDYTADALRFSIGFRYNPGRWYEAR
jgi:hypothetical protein